MSSARIAVLDDEPGMVEIVSMVLRRSGHDVLTFTDPETCLRSIAEEPVDLLLTDLKMPSMSGVEVLRRARRATPALSVVLFTAHATVETAIAAIREGAYDYIEKPFDNAELRALCGRALEHAALRADNRYLREARGEPTIIAESAAMKRVLSLVRRVAPTRSTVLITGESGTGKEVVARAMHGYSERRESPLVALNVKALSETVLESELFGHEKGAFTGADKSRRGVFERADGGTLFLDEIGEVSLSFQAKLLRVLQEREVQPVGGTQPRSIDVRLVAATNRDLGAEVLAGRFREDLYFRLAVIPIHLPPLGERVDDVLPLARGFLAQKSREIGRTIVGWSSEVSDYLTSHPWPGNVRELENTIERGVILAEGDRLELSDVRLEGPVLSGGVTEMRASSSDEPAGERLVEHLDRATRDHLRRVLDECEGKRVEAARRLGIDRTTLYRLMRKHGVSEAP